MPFDKVFSPDGWFVKADSTDFVGIAAGYFVCVIRMEETNERETSGSDSSR
jgi:hypothetical protein